MVIGLQTTGEARLDAAVKAHEDLDEYAGMKEVVKSLLSKFPTGDYMGTYAEMRPPRSDLRDETSEMRSSRSAHRVFTTAGTL